LFEMLKDDEGKSHLLSKLSNRALSMIGGEESADQENPLFEALRNYSNRSELFTDFLQRAMPWIGANLEYLREQSPHEQYTCIIGVHQSGKFSQEFGEELKSKIPSALTRMRSSDIKFLDIGQEGKLICYVELTGLPTPSLNSLDEWYNNYLLADSEIPVNTHRLAHILVHPREFTTDELKSRAEDFNLFVQAVAIGVLTRVERGIDADAYRVTNNGTKSSIGVEKNLRQNGLDRLYLKTIREQIDADLDSLKTADQLAIWVALMEIYRDSVYPSVAKKKTGKADKPLHCFPTVLCARLTDAWRARLDKLTGGAEISEQLMQKARDAINKWTVEIAGSEKDVYAHEVGEDHKPKRVLKREVLQEGWSLSGAVAPTAQGVGVATPPPLASPPATGM
ncbi:MAG: hypothetical protein ORN54_02325, partial [Cyclobacteriaceae bacterium]|nr:hypothetical protein [Cyclobacteriaceae bacterium]